MGVEGGGGRAIAVRGSIFKLNKLWVTSKIDEEKIFRHRYTHCNAFCNQNIFRRVSKVPFLVFSFFLAYFFICTLEICPITAFISTYCLEYLIAIMADKQGI